MKHGPIDLIDKDMPLRGACAQGQCLHEKVLSNIQEINARGGRVIAIASEGDREIEKHAEHVIYIPMLSPLLSVIPLQLLAYHIAALQGL